MQTLLVNLIAPALAGRDGVVFVERLCRRPAGRVGRVDLIAVEKAIRQPPVRGLVGAGEHSGER